MYDEFGTKETIYIMSDSESRTISSDVEIEKNFGKEDAEKLKKKMESPDDLIIEVHDKVLTSADDFSWYTHK